jgi:hypothetical protein
MRLFKLLKQLDTNSSQRHFRRIGQINQGSQLGRWIEVLSSLNEVKVIIEVGTWSGRGSSRMIGLGISKSALEVSKSVIGLEIDPRMANSASRYLRRFPNFRVIHGRIVDQHELDTKNLSTAEQLWYEKDLLNFENSPNVFYMIPPKIDLLILDGGEFSSFAEFMKLKSRIAGWVVLDDTLIRKNREVHESLKNDSNFSLVWESSERNGCSIFRRV